MRDFVLLAVTAISLVSVALLPRMPQDPAYHVLADQRAFLGIPNCLNVISNLPFAIVGIAGLVVALRQKEPWERWPYAVFFAGVVLTTFGSAYYHLAPDNARLVWDRLPMAISVMALVTAMIAERLSPNIARRVFAPFLLVGAGSVIYWYWTELQQQGDLRPYIVVQFVSPLIILLMMFLYPARRSGAKWLFAGLGLYAAARVFELADQRIFDLGHIMSGHTLKHLAAGGAVACVAVMLRGRV